MNYKIRGSNLPIVDIELSEGESVFSESGGMAWMSSNIEMSTSTRGGLGAGLSRMLSGESLFMTTYKCVSGTGVVSFCMESPGNVIPFDFNEGQALICQKDAFMVAQEDVTVEAQMTKRLTAGFFGGEGFFMQKISGKGLAFLEIAGELTEYTLEKGQTLKVDPGYIGAFEPTVDYNITRVKGFKNVIFGGEGLFLATLTGPGKVWLQSMPLVNLAHSIARYIPSK